MTASNGSTPSSNTSPRTKTSTSGSPASTASNTPPRCSPNWRRTGSTRSSRPALSLTSDLPRCEHIVGLMGHEPIAAAIEHGADVVLAGRATDTAMLAAVPLMRGCPPGPSWHAAKIAECGGLCTTSPFAGGVLFTVDADGFTIEPLDPDNACTPTSVAAHMLYENADPFRMREPAGTLDTTDATYTAVDNRRARRRAHASSQPIPTP